MILAKEGWSIDSRGCKQWRHQVPWTTLPYQGRGSSTFETGNEEFHGTVDEDPTCLS